MKRSLGRILSNITCILLLASGTLFTIFLFGNVHLTEDFKVGTRYVTMFSIIALIIVVGIEVSSIIFDKEYTPYTLQIALMLLAYIVTSHDAINMLEFAYEVKNPIIFEFAHSVSYFGVIFFILRLYMKSYQFNKTPFYKMALSMLAVVAITDNILVLCHLQFISSLIILQFALLVYFTLFFVSLKRKTLNLPFILTGFNFFIITSAYIAASTGTMYGNYPLGLESWFIFVIFVLILALYADHLVKVLKKSYAAQEYEDKVKELQATILMEQINPHFIFNSLVLIKSIYLEDRAKGDRAIDYLARHIRANVDVKGGKILIPIEDELKNIECIVGLANMVNKAPINVIYNIDAYKFDVPALSIEPFIENAIKYSRIQSKKDGYIEVATEETDKAYVVRISDNGVGFTKEDRAKKPNSNGIRNALYRFEFLLHAKTNVVSEKNQGTTIEIIIPKEEKEGN